MRVYYARVGGGDGWAPLDERVGVQRGYLLGASTSWPSSAGASRTGSLDQFHQVFRADGTEQVSMRKGLEMVCALIEGLEQQRQRPLGARPLPTMKMRTNSGD